MSLVVRADKKSLNVPAGVIVCVEFKHGASQRVSSEKHWCVFGHALGKQCRHGARDGRTNVDRIDDTQRDPVEAQVFPGLIIS